MKYLIIILITCSICMGCKKNRTAVVKGRVINPITNEGFAGYEVWLQKTTAGSIGTTGGFETIEETTTDANGYFEIEGKSSGNLNIRCVDEDNYSIGWYQNGEKINNSTQTMSVPKGEETYAEYHSVPNGTYQLVLRNVNCNDYTDTIKVTRYRQIPYLTDFGALVYSGCDEIAYGSGDSPMGYVWSESEVIRNGVSSIIYDTVFVQPGQLNQHIIEY